MPTTSRPGIGATIRMEIAARARARSSESPTIFDNLMPGAGRYSKVVITGPGRISTTSPFTLKSASLFFKMPALRLSSSVSIGLRIFCFSSRKDNPGRTKSSFSRISFGQESATYSLSSVSTATMVGPRDFSDSDFFSGEETCRERGMGASTFFGMSFPFVSGTGEKSVAATSGATSSPSFF